MMEWVIMETETETFCKALIPIVFPRIISNRNRRSNVFENGLFLGIETDTFCKFLVPIFYLREVLTIETEEEETIYLLSFWAQKQTECVSFCAQKLMLWARDTISKI
jgi:hypothetical protein